MSLYFWCYKLGLLVNKLLNKKKKLFSNLYYKLTSNSNSLHQKYKLYKKDFLP